MRVKVTAKDKKMAKVLEGLINIHLGKCCNMDHVNKLVVQRMFTLFIGRPDMPIRHRCECACHFKEAKSES
jgi:hypothetical protein